MLGYAKNNKLIFLSVGYSTFYWCHGMAGKILEHKKTAAYLNEYFVSIKVDKEQRSDIDGFFMELSQREEVIE